VRQPVAVGPPPRAGVVSAVGDVVVWRDGTPVVVGRWPGTRVKEAFESRHGTVLLASAQTAIVRPDGEFRLLGTDMGRHGAVDPAGERLAVVETHAGRRSRLHVFFLRDGACETMPETGDSFLSVVGMYDGTVYARGSRRGALRWTPGSEPERLPYDVLQVERYAGALLADGQRNEDERLLVHPNGTTRKITGDRRATLTPWATHFQLWTHEPPTLTLIDVLEPRTRINLPLPGGSETSGTSAAPPLWEDPAHVLLPARIGQNTRGHPLARLDMRTGVAEGVALTDDTRHRSVLVVPLPTVQ
jgi:hypothetical protein